MNLQGALRIGLVLFLVFPFLFLFTQFDLTEWPDFAELIWAFKNSFIQAFLSAIISLVLGLWVALGLLSLHSSRWRQLHFLFEILCLLPNLLPSIFILLSVLNVMNPFPMGIAGIVIIHSLMNFGLVGVLLSRIINSKLGGVMELAYVEGASRRQFFVWGLLPMLRKDLWLLGLFVFVVCFSSFAVPLVVGGGKGTTVEVLIYEKIRLASDWGGAVLLAFLQSLFIFGLSLIYKQSWGNRQRPTANFSLVHSVSGVLVVALISFGYLFGYFQGLYLSPEVLSSFSGFQSELLVGFIGTIALGMSVGVLSYFGLLLIAYCWPKIWFERFLNGYVAPSTALTCFSLLILGPNEGLYPFIKIPLALTLLGLNGLFRMGWDSELQGLKNQINIAYLMGASSYQIFREILFPQISQRAGLLAGLASIWACGDFAVSRVLAHKDLSIAMMTETLMSGYRLNQAILLSGLIVLAGLICFALCLGGSRVLSRKFAS